MKLFLMVIVGIFVGHVVGHAILRFIYRNRNGLQVTTTGTKVWMKYNQTELQELYREDGPAFIRNDGVKQRHMDSLFKMLLNAILAKK